MSGLPVGMANVPSKSNHTGKDGQVWERLWTLEEMRQTSANWSLAADSGLFLFLQDFSQRMLSKTHEIEKQLDGLIRDTKATDCCVHTVFNDFLMLSNTQFIENRVYDEEVVPKPEALERPPEQKTREQKEAQLIPKVQEAVNYGLMVLDSAFEQLDIKAGNSDSEDEEATDRVEPILEPKDLYVDRPLPYLIGSQLFMGQEDVGLGDLSSEGRSPLFLICHLTSSHDIAVFTSHFFDLLTPVRVVVAIEDDGEELFGPPKMEDEDLSPFGGKGGLFSGGRGLFDEVGSHERRFVVLSDESILSSSFPIENSLFGTPNDSDSVGGRENGSPAKPHKTQTSAPRKTALGGLFDDEEDDFFTGKSLNKSSSAGQEEPKQRKTVDLSGGGDEDGDIFSENSGVLPPLQSRREVVEEEEEQVKQSPQKKMPAGGVSMFGPGTKSLLTEPLKKQRPSTSEESEEVGVLFYPSSLYAISLFLSNSLTRRCICPTIPKSQSKPEPTLQSKAHLSIFVDEEDKDLFASAKKSKSSQTEDATPQVKKPVSRTLFSEDEDHWMSSKHSAGKTGGMKSSYSARYSLPSVKADPFDSLFDEDDDDLFAATKELSQKKPQRVSLLFQDETEDGEDKGSLFGFKPAINNSSTLVQPLSSLLEGSESKKKPVGAVSLFGGINVLGDRLGAAKQTKSPLDETDGDDFLSKEGPPPMEKESKMKKNTISLFDDEGADWTVPISIPSKPAAINTLKERPHTKSSTGVFQDEERLFSHTQQRDNHPDVDIFATSSVKSRPSSVRSAAPTLFSDEDEDDLFSSVKPKALRPLMNKCVPPPHSQTTLVINPAALLPSASPWILGGVSGLPGLSPSPAWTQSPSNRGLSFDHPVQVSVLQCANKGRAKGSIRRRPQTRAARQISAQRSVDQKNQGEDRAGHSPTLPHPTQPSLALPNPIQPSLALPNLTLPRPRLPNQVPTTALPSLPASLPSQPLLTDVSVRPSVLTLPVSNTPLKRDFSKGCKVKVLPSPDEADLFGSDSPFGSVPAQAPVPKLTTPSPKLTTKTTEGELTPKKEKEATPPSLFDDPVGDLFQKVKPRSAKKAKASSFLEDEEDIFVLGKSSTPTTKITAGGKFTKAGSNSTPKQDLFQVLVRMINIVS
uniref:FAM21/CAPZIP domain-containing protein n=1 Tax=Salmo trutta TaxID=8032 RepID=A0A674AED9_SALTR